MTRMRSGSTRRRDNQHTSAERAYEERVHLVRTAIKANSTFASARRATGSVSRAAFTDCLRALGYTWTREKSRLRRTSIAPTYHAQKLAREQWARDQRRRERASRAIIVELHRMSVAKVNDARRKSLRDALRMTRQV